MDRGDRHLRHHIPAQTKTKTLKVPREQLAMNVARLPYDLIQISVLPDDQVLLLQVAGVFPNPQPEGNHHCRKTSGMGHSTSYTATRRQILDPRWWPRCAVCLVYTRRGPLVKALSLKMALSLKNLNLVVLYLESKLIG